ncbi:hypothetical protein SELMODRAFT_427535 [Selaginella moellendorffii]|uniref:Uncharacterized protein n=1 Tax=Selaginella moellendorffii TaxID=88036 RepID=D8SZX3_SELML|nr:hypothetical protein SELMODRAFT_427535 [Selaginella moellendorffii]
MTNIFSAMPDKGRSPCRGRSGSMKVRSSTPLERQISTMRLNGTNRIQLQELEGAETISAVSVNDDEFVILHGQEVQIMAEFSEVHLKVGKSHTDFFPFLPRKINPPKELPTAPRDILEHLTSVQWQKQRSYDQPDLSHMPCSQNAEDPAALLPQCR